MTDTRYQIVITGEITGEQTRDQAIARFSETFKLSDGKVRAAFDKAPVAVKKGLDGNGAEKYRRALQGIGIDCRIEPVSANPPTSAGPSLGGGVDQTEEEGAQSGLSFRVEGQPDYSFAAVQLPEGQVLKVEASAMAGKDANIRMTNGAGRGAQRGDSGEPLSINEFTAEGGPGEITIAPGVPGEMVHRYLRGETILVQNSAFVACTPGVGIDTEWQPLASGFFSSESLCLVRSSGTGDLWFNSYGGIVGIDVDGEYVVDTGYLAAFEGTLDYRVSRVGGYRSVLFSGEGFGCRFSGKGRLWIQTRRVDAFVHWLYPFRPVMKVKRKKLDG